MKLIVNAHTLIGGTTWNLTFVTIVLADHDYINNISIQNQLVRKDIPYDITSSQMFFRQVPLEDAWIILMWDMMSKKLHVLDPLIRGTSSLRGSCTMLCFIA